MFQLFAHQPIWRVVEIMWTSETLDGKPRHVTGRIEYRWTHKSAEKLRDKRAREAVQNFSRSGFVVQGGIVHWVPDDEWDTALAATEWNREQNVDDRDEHGPAVTWTRARRRGE